MLPIDWLRMTVQGHTRPNRKYEMHYG